MASDTPRATVADRIRALRAPFLTVTILPFAAGTLTAKDVDWLAFAIGLGIAVCTHLGANVINDYADSKSGADWHDPKSFQFFGGSKLIQQKVLGEAFFLHAAIFFSVMSVVLTAILTVMKRDPVIPICFVLIHVWGYSYTHPPLKLAYRRLGEFTLFVLCGPAVVVGGRYIQSGKLIETPALLLSLPFAWQITHILFTNEVPDYATDTASNKRNLVGVTGPARAWVLQLVFAACMYASIGICVWRGALHPFSLVSLLAAPLAIQSALGLKRNHGDKEALVPACVQALTFNTAVAVIIVVDTAIWTTW